MLICTNKKSTQQSQLQHNEKDSHATPPVWRPVKVIFGLSAIAVCAKMLGFIEKIIIAYFFGTTKIADIYFAVMGVVLTIVFMVKELVYPSVLPVFSRTLMQTSAISGSLFRKLFLTVAGFLVIIVVILTVFTPFITNVLVPGFTPSQQKTTSYLLRLLGPSIIFLGLMTLTYTTLNARKRFWISALGEMGFKMLVAVGLLAFLPFMGIYAVAPTVGISTLACLAYHLRCLDEREYILKFHINSDLSNRLFKGILKLMAPLVIGVVFSHISALIDNMLASKLPSGQLSYLNYAKKIIDAILLIGPVAVMTVVYAQASHLASMKQQEEFAQLIRKAFRVLLYISVPITCLLIELREPFLRCLFQHGRFDTISTIGTSKVLLVYAFGLITFSLEALLVYSFYALSDTKTPTKIGVICVFIDIILAVALLKHFEYLGIAAALVISKTMKIIILTNKLAKKVKGLFDADILFFASKLAAATAVLWVVLKIFACLNKSVSFVHTITFNLILPGSAGVLVFLISSYFLNISELRMLVSIFINRRKGTKLLMGTNNDDRISSK